MITNDYNNKVVDITLELNKIKLHK